MERLSRTVLRPSETTLAVRGSHSRGLLNHKRPSLLARRSWASHWDEGTRGFPGQTRLLNLASPLLSSLSSVICVQTEDRVIALTFDDGPDPRFTPLVLDALAMTGTRATFFLLSSAGRRYPALVQRAVAEGHEIALHGVDHSRTTTWRAREAAERLSSGKTELEDVAQVAVTLYRPTYGAQRLNLVRAARRLGLETVIWSGWAQDWRGDAPAEVTARAVRACHPGGILLLHDTLAGLDDGVDPEIFSPEVTTRLLQHLRRETWEFATVSELLDTYQHVRSAWFERPDLKRSQPS